MSGVTGWELKPPTAPCTACGGTPYDETKRSKPPLDVAIALGVDVDWGNDLIICQSCIGHLADLVGRDSQEVVQKLKEELEQTSSELQEADAKLEKQQKLIDKVRDGGKAKKELAKV